MKPFETMIKFKGLEAWRRARNLRTVNRDLIPRKS
jgi:hypothetical protein